ncbi:SMP-30/gluconolactonase/LRE family protein [Propionivibrio dicarboxylicus]|uniref:Sugar lactone lactonase YvrE n=1 Tax=Propionivibrio dicarboxylicus TaxID=83767 RepID=A0A1G8KMJ8_9RHOO|nr:SMP-30/gluconolactonase/LRE family protein [Propionivibrio dicarboxylicus]SDI44120.1 Sugar lactone lactonase YvrE [Propionivibrio dicarboxylicus]
MNSPASPNSSSLVPAINGAAFDFVGRGLHRPECVLCTARGDVFASDWRGGVSHLLPDGSQGAYLGRLPDGGALRPNGISLEEDGSFLIAHLGDTTGGVYRLTRGGGVSVFLDRVDGDPLPPTNYVFTDRVGRRWITVSTRHVPRAAAYRGDVADGFVVLVDDKGARIVADALGYTNEAYVSPDGNALYINETFGRRLLRYAILPNGDLGRREVVTEFGTGVFPDGLAFDQDGCVWITSIISNRVIRVFPDGSQQLMIEDADTDHVDWVEDAFRSGTLGRPHLDNAGNTVLKNVSSIAFGGAGLRTLHLGCLLGDRIACLRQDVAGYPPVHWEYR